MDRVKFTICQINKFAVSCKETMADLAADDGKKRTPLNFKFWLITLSLEFVL